jgi:hypothetical protein
MKINVDGVELFVLSDTQKKVIANDVSNDVLDSDLKRRLQYILMHKYERCFDRLKKEWEPKLAASGLKSIPTDVDEFANLVFLQPNYKDRAARDSESKVG